MVHHATNVSSLIHRTRAHAPAYTSQMVSRVGRVVRKSLSADFCRFKEI